MSDGAKESTEGDNLNSDTRIPRDHDFARLVSKVAVAQICENVGFQSCGESAIDGFAEIALRYISDLALGAVSSANSAGRTQCNVFDLINGMQNLPRKLGFPDVLGQLAEEMKKMDELPFSQPIPHFPILQIPAHTPSFVQMRESPAASHLPPWLPAFPDPHTYIFTPMWTERKTNPREEKIEQTRQRRKAEKSLLRLQGRLLRCAAPVTSSDNVNSSERNKFFAVASSSSSPELPDGHERATTVAGNQFLAPPLKEGGGINVSQVALPARFTEAAALDLLPSHHCCEMNGICYESVHQKRPLPEKRGKVQFRVVSGKRRKPGEGEGGEMVQKSCTNIPVIKMAPVFTGNDSRKKRRVEVIPRESMQNSNEIKKL